jgi:SAM-dependent methyltransferase
MNLKKELLDLMECPKCRASLLEKEGVGLVCSKCGYTAKSLEGIPLFTDIPQTIQPWEKVERGPEKGTAWRKSNWKFLNQVVSDLPAEHKILDVGAGHGDFADIFVGRKYYSLDIVPYLEVDLVADLGETNPFKDGTFNAVVLMNVLEHVYESRRLIKSITRILAPDGIVVLTVPFLLKVHQAPFDFSRYTPYFIGNMAAEAGLQVESLQGYYDPQYLLNESLGNVWQYSIDSQPKWKQFFAKVMVAVAQHMINDLAMVTRKGFTAPVQSQSNPAPVGYLVVLRKKAS